VNRRANGEEKCSQKKEENKYTTKIKMTNIKLAQDL
jgi:hypothetical protein